MIFGIVVMGFGVFILLVYVFKGVEDDEVVDDFELDDVEKSLEIMGVIFDLELLLENVFERKFVVVVFFGVVLGFIGGVFYVYFKGMGDYYCGVVMVVFISIVIVGVLFYEIKEIFWIFVLFIIWGWMVVVFIFS